MGIFDDWKPEFWKKRNDGNRMIFAEIGHKSSSKQCNFPNYFCKKSKKVLSLHP